MNFVFFHVNWILTTVVISFICTTPMTHKVTSKCCFGQGDIYRIITSSQPPVLGTCTIWRVATVKPTTWKLSLRCHAESKAANRTGCRCHKMWRVIDRSLRREENQLQEARMGQRKQRSQKEKGPRQPHHSPPKLNQLLSSWYCLSLSRIKLNYITSTYNYKWWVGD